MEKPETTYPIRAVAQKTGLSPFVIRAWEKRYKAVFPSRTPTNRRMYSDADVRRLALLRAATHAGHRIGHVVSLDDEELRRIADRASAGSLSRHPWLPGETARNLLQGCLDAVSMLDRAGLEVCLGAAEVNLSMPVLLEELVSPLLVAAGENWRSGEWRVGHEHMASAAVRGMLHRAQMTPSTPPHAAGLVVTTPAGQRHEIGALMASVVAAAQGWRNVYLGPDMPAHDIVDAVRRTNARALALSIIYPSDDPFLPKELDILREHLPAGFPILVGGAGSSAYDDALRRAQAQPLATLSSFRDELVSLRRASPAK